MIDTVTWPIEEMSVAEKLQLMERLWVDLSSCPAEIPTPEWHAEVLSEREKAIRDGRTSFIDWDVAKEKLRETAK